MTGPGSSEGRGGGAAARFGKAAWQGLWRVASRFQHSSEPARRLVVAATKPLRYRDLRVVRGRMAGVRLNLGGSFLRYLTGDAEPEVQQVLEELLRPGQVVYDVGANIGFFTILCSRLVGPEGHVYAFEPIPENLHTLRRNIALNDLRNVTIVEKALSSSTGTAEMFVSPWSAFHSLNVEGATKVEDHGPQEGEITVQTVTLDEFLTGEGVRAPDLVKIDVEGAELIVVQGMGETLRSRRPLLLVELHDTKHGYAEFVKSIDYRARVIDGDGPELADADRNVHTIAWPQERELDGLASLARRS